MQNPPTDFSRFFVSFAHECVPALFTRRAFAKELGVEVRILDSWRYETRGVPFRTDLIARTDALYLRLKDRGVALKTPRFLLQPWGSMDEVINDLYLPIIDLSRALGLSRQTLYTIKSGTVSIDASSVQQVLRFALDQHQLLQRVPTPRRTFLLYPEEIQAISTHTQERGQDDDTRPLRD